MVTAGVEAQPRVLRDSQEGRGTEETNHHPPRGQVPTGEIINFHCNNITVFLLKIRHKINNYA